MTAANEQPTESAHIAAALREHRCRHNPANGSALCECGWTGPYTRAPGRDMADHLATIVVAALSTPPGKQTADEWLDWPEIAWGKDGAE